MIRTFAALLALTVAASAADSSAPKPKQLWRTAKATIELGISTLKKQPPKGTKIDWWKAAKQPWDVAARSERTQDAVCETVVRRASAEEKTESERVRRATAARTLRDFRKLAIYGWFVPNVMREMAEGDSAAAPVAELFPFLMTEDEMTKRDRALIAETGVTGEEYKALARVEESK